MADDSDGASGTGADGFTVINDDETADDVEGQAPDDVPETRAIDAARVRQLSAMRRATHRGRSYCLIAVCICAVAVAQLALLTFRHVRAAGWQLRPFGYVCAAAAAGMAGLFFVRRAAEMTRELRRRPAALDDPPQPPDFSTLSDGSQSWKNLEKMQRGGS